MLSLSMTLYLQYALKEWYPGEIMKPCIQKFLNRHELLIQLASKLIGEQLWIRMLKHQQAAVNQRVQETRNFEEEDIA